MCNSVLLFVSHCFALSWPGRSCKRELVLNWTTWLNKGEINCFIYFLYGLTKTGLMNQTCLTKTGLMNQTCLTKTGLMNQTCLTKTGLMNQTCLTKTGLMNQTCLTKTGLINQTCLTKTGLMNQTCLDIFHQLASTFH